MTNENVLRGYRCPKCGSEEPFIIEGMANFYVTDEGTSVHDSVEWEDDSGIGCVQCGHDGLVSDFRIPDKQRYDLDLDLLTVDIQREILLDMTEGIVPEDVTSFAALHDHVDANMYAEDSRERIDRIYGWDTLIDMLNVAQCRVDRWLATRYPSARSPYSHGYRVEHMGGGCKAWRRDAPGGYILINNNDDITGDPDARVWAVGRCLADEEDEDLGWIAALDLTLDEALRVADRLPLPSEGWSEQATDEQVAEWLGRAE